jgi:hypothetical protein
MKKIFIKLLAFLKITSIIPKGYYCYDWIETPCHKNNYRGKVKNCPYWDLNKSKHSQDNGYCHFLKCGDWENTYTSLLWDGVKECQIKEYSNEIYFE